MVVAVAQAGDLAIAVQPVLRQARPQRLDDLLRAADDAAGAAVDPAGDLDRLGLGLGLAEPQDRALIELGEALEAEFGQQGGQQRLALRPEPGGAQIHRMARQFAIDGQDSAAPALSRLEQFEVLPVPVSCAARASPHKPPPTIAMSNMSLSA